MSVLFRIVYAAHANGTHHKLALDALYHLGRGDAEAWRRVFLKHVGRYLQGSKAPDDTFKDFKNHVLHVGDTYWGGAPEKAAEWYGKTVAALRAGQWDEAAYSAGVLSHYYTDPVMPFHTGQTEAENAIHRGCEWSINRSYNALRRDAEAAYADLEAPIPAGGNWLKEFVCDGAEYSHRYYEKLIAHYDITRGAVSPEDGLDSVGRKIVSELLMYAAEGFGNMLDRAITEAGVDAPEVSLTIDTVIATLKVPQKWLEKRLSNAEDRRIVQAMYDELKATGRVESSLPEDDRTIRDLYTAEVQGPKDAALAKARAKRLGESPAAAKPAPQVSTILPPRAAATPPAPGPAKQQPPLPVVAAPAAAVERSIAVPPIADKVPVAPVGPERAVQAPPPVPAPAVSALPAAVKPATSVPVVAQKLAAGGVAPVLPPSAPAVAVKPAAPPTQQVAAVTAPVAQAEARIAPPPVQAPPPAASTTPPQAKAPAVAPPAAPRDFAESTPKRAAPEPRKSYLAKSDDLEAAPSIGPKMAELFADLGIKTVADFLGQDPHDMAEILDDGRIDAEMLTDWQDQAQLVIDVPGLRGTHAQLLVGAGYRTADAIADADPVDLSADVLTFASSSDGKRILRDGNPPDLEKIKSWVDSAREAMAA
jgi:predicted flap endonuclease-1-like 5' DNA nuclease